MIERLYVRSMIYRLALGWMDFDVTAVKYVSVPCLHPWAKMQALYGKPSTPVYLGNKGHKVGKLGNQFVNE